MTTLGITDDVKVFFTPAGLLRKNILKYVEQPLIRSFMQQLLGFITALATLPVDQHETYLMKFPPRTSIEYACLQGTMERLQSTLQELQLQSCTPTQAAILAAHLTVIEKGRSRCAPLFHDGVQPHVTAAVEYITGFDDLTGIGKAVSYDVRANIAWDIYLNYSKQMNEELQRNRNETIARLTALVDAEPIDEPKILEFCRERKINTDFIDASDPENIIYSRERILELIPTIEIEPLVDDLFDLASEEAPAKIAAWYCNDNATKKLAAIKALRLLCHPSQKGSRIIPFIQCFHEIGFRFGNSPAEALSQGIINFFLSAPASNDVDIIKENITRYTKGPKAVSTYMSYLGSETALPSLSYLVGSGTDLPPLDELLRYNAPLTLIKQKIDVSTPNELALVLPPRMDALEHFVHHPDAAKILCYIVSRIKVQLVLLPSGSPIHAECAAYLTTVGSMLVCLSVSHHCPEILECVQNNFGLMPPIDSASSLQGLRMLKGGLFDHTVIGYTLSLPFVNAGAILATQNTALFVEKLRLIKTELHLNVAELLLHFKQNGLQPGFWSIRYKLVLEGNLSAIKQIFSLLTPAEQGQVINVHGPYHLNSFSLAFENNHKAVAKYFLSLKHEDGTPVVDQNRALAIALEKKQQDIILLLITNCAVISKENLRQLIAEGIDISSTGKSLLHIALEHNEFDLIPSILALKKLDGTPLVDVNQVNKTGKTAVMVAVEKGSSVTFQRLICCRGDCKRFYTSIYA